MNVHKHQTKQILVTPRTISQIGTRTFKEKSMTVPDKYYTVSRTGNGLVCECPDHQYRKSDCKYINVILGIIKQNKGYANNEFKIMERININLCKYCISDNIKKDDYRTNKRDKF